MAKSNRFSGIHLAPSFILPLCIAYCSPHPYSPHFLLSQCSGHQTLKSFIQHFQSVILHSFFSNSKYCNASGSVLGWFFKSYTHSDDFKYIVTMHKYISQPTSSFEIQTYTFSLTYLVRCLTSIFFFASLIEILFFIWEENNKVL